MGYTTEFEGVLEFECTMTGPMFSDLSKFFTEDMRDHPEWGDMGDCYYIQFELTKDFSGIKWDGSEKFYGAVDAVNIIARNMQKKYPEFRFKGELRAQGEDMDDRWILRINDDGVAERVNMVFKGQRVNCPHCGGQVPVVVEWSEE